MIRITKLKHCPFCGSSNVDISGFWRFAVKCHNCGAKGKPSSNWDAAIENWNSRALTATQAYADEMFDILSDIRRQLWDAINNGEQANISVIDIQNVIDAVKKYAAINHNSVIQNIGYGAYLARKRDISESYKQP